MAITDKSVEEMLKALESRQSAIFNDISSALGQGGIKVFGGAIDAAQEIFNEGLKQAVEYEEKIVNVYGDISLQQETFGKSAAKLQYEQVESLRQSFLEMEESGIRLADVFGSADEAAQAAEEIIGNFHGSAIQFTDDLQGQNLRITQLLQKASGLSGHETAAIMKIAKARGEDSRQMLADIGTFSKQLADKFGMDTKVVAGEVAKITTNVETFGKVSVEAATAAAVKFQSLGVSVEDVSNSIGRAFGSFDSAATASAQLSQSLGVNIDSMQMMVDMNSGPDGMLKALDDLRENVIGAGVDVSELSAPLIRTFKQITNIADDETLFALFDPERAGVDTDAILEAADKAAEAQKAPADAIKMMDNDIAKVMRSMEQMKDLVGQQQLTRLGQQARGSAIQFSQLSNSSAEFFNNANLFLEKIPAVKGALDTTFKTAEGTARVARETTRAHSEMVKREYEVSNPGQTLTGTRQIDYTERLEAGRGAAQDPEYQRVTGYVLPPSIEQMLKENGQVRNDVIAFLDKKTPAQGKSDALGRLAQMMGADQATAEKIIKVLGGKQQAGVAGAPPAGGPLPGGTSASPTVLTPAGAALGAVAPVSPAGAAPTGPAAPAPAASTPATPVPAAAAPAAPVAAPPAAAASAFTGGSAAATAGGSSPINLTLNVTLDSKQIAQQVSSTGIFVLQRQP
jgi:hypothetical protein